MLVIIIFTVIMIRTGHKVAVEKSEANLRAKYDAGQSSEEARELMRKAVYNV